MIGAIKVLAGLVGLAEFWSKWFEKKEERDVGRKLEQGERAEQAVRNSEAVNGARNDRGTVDRVREQSYRD